MEALKMKCPGCGEKIEIQPIAGKVYRCIKCNTVWDELI
jgi:ribosomal protein L37AE/L43A